MEYIFDRTSVPALNSALAADGIRDFGWVVLWWCDDWVIRSLFEVTIRLFPTISV